MCALRKTVCLGLGLFLFFALPCCNDSPDGERKSVPPELDTTPLFLDFGKEEEQLALSLQNRGQGTLEWDVSTESSWITVDPAVGRTDSGTTIQVRVVRTGFTAGTYDGFLDVRSNGGDERVRVALEIAPLLSVDTDTLDFGMVSDKIAFHVTNEGSGILEWTLQPSSDWFQVAPTAGSTSVGASAVTASLDRTKTWPGENTANLEVSSSGGSLTVPVIAQEPTGTIFYLGPTGELAETPFSQQALWSRRITHLPFEWVLSFSEERTIRLIKTHITMSAQDPSEITLTAALRRQGQEILFRELRPTVDSIYPHSLRDTLDFEETGARPGDQLIISIRSVEDSWLFLGSDPEKNSYLILE